jgi:uncharacterized membrane protein (DUF373 family)
MLTTIKLFLFSICVLVAIVSWCGLCGSIPSIFNPETVAGLIAAIAIALFCSFLLSSSAYFGYAIAYQLIGTFGF